MRDIEYAYAILRIDDFHVADLPIEHKVCVKRVMWDREEARRETVRLNGLHTCADGKVRYYVTLARVDVRSVAVGEQETA